MHVGQFETVVPKRQRFTIVSVLNSNDQPLPSLSHHNRPLTSIRYSIAGILPTNVQNDGSNCRIEEVLDNMVPLFPVGGCFVVVVVEYLIEVVLGGVVGELILRVFYLLLEVSEPFPGVGYC